MTVTDPILRNWAGNQQFTALGCLRPRSLDEAQAAVAESAHIRPLGTAHSFSPLAETSQIQLSLADLPRVIEVNDARDEVWVSAAVTYGDLAVALREHGLALHNLASLPHISVAGACATGTHGSGDQLGNLATAVTGLRVIRADGQLAELGGADLVAEVVGLGCLGAVTHLRLSTQPFYEVAQVVFDGLPRARLIDSLDEIFSAATSVSVFTTWDESESSQVWLKQRCDQAYAWPAHNWLGAQQRTTPAHPLPDHDPIHCTAQLAEPGPWFDRLPHFQMAFTPSSGDEIQAEYLLPRDQASRAIEAIEGVRGIIHPILHATEIRSVAADSLWLSANYQRPTIGIHFTWHKTNAVYEVLPVIDSLLAPLGARPHWGKVTTFTPAMIVQAYPRFREFAERVRTLDPGGKFGNEMTDALIDAALQASQA
jgi:xylitol oxidase